MTALAPGWTLGTISNCVSTDGVFPDGDWVESKDQDPEGDVRLIQLADIGEGIFRNRSNRFLTSSKAEELACTFLEPGDILIARMPDPLGRACVLPEVGQPCVTAVDVCIVRTGENGVDARWLMWAINAPQFRAKVFALQAGTTRKRISRKNLATIELPVPPLNEQRRIAAAIDEQFSRIDAADESLRRVKFRLVGLTRVVFSLAVAVGDEGRVDDLLDGIEAGRSFKCHTRRASMDEWGVVKVSAMTWGAFNEREHKAVASNDQIDVPLGRFDPVISCSRVPTRLSTSEQRSWYERHVLDSS